MARGGGRRPAKGRGGGGSIDKPRLDEAEKNHSCFFLDII